MAVSRAPSPAAPIRSPPLSRLIAALAGERRLRRRRWSLEHSSSPLAAALLGCSDLADPPPLSSVPLAGSPTLSLLTISFSPSLLQSLSVFPLSLLLSFLFFLYRKNREIEEERRERDREERERRAWREGRREVADGETEQPKASRRLAETADGERSMMIMARLLKKRQAWRRLARTDVADRRAAAWAMATPAMDGNCAAWRRRSRRAREAEDNGGGEQRSTRRAEDERPLQQDATDRSATTTANGYGRSKTAREATTGRVRVARGVAAGSSIARSHAVEKRRAAARDKTSKNAAGTVSRSGRMARRVATTQR
ncbi:hypothetical protein Scep_007548 [Stephania cephalantha]|uniref:Uncharacterized protein n=1 Tax=Stephania cephalantha TaxID=152367 RepID=A0AAP0KA40_9MAGN